MVSPSAVPCLRDPVLPTKSLMEGKVTVSMKAKIRGNKDGPKNRPDHTPPTLTYRPIGASENKDRNKPAAACSRPALVSNITPQSVRFLTDQKLDPGSLVRLKLDFGRKSPTIRVRARVLWVMRRETNPGYAVCAQLILPHPPLRKFFFLTARKDRQRKGS